MSGTPRSIDAGPLIDFVERRGGPTAAGIADPATRKAFQRARASGLLTWSAADRLAVRVMGRHPAAAFGRDWWRA